MWFDTHIHLTCLDFPESYLERYAALAVAISPDDWADLIQLISSHPSSQCYAAIGLHPWALYSDKQALHAVLQEMEQRLSKTPALAIGEVGLDFDPRTAAPHSMQLYFLEGCLALAQRFERPISLHLRHCFVEFEHLLKQYAGVKGFLHGFSGGVHWAERLLPLGNFKIGVNGVLCRANARRYHALVRYVGLESLVVETDGPFGRCPDADSFEQSDIERIGKAVATLLHQPVETVKSVTYKNAMSILQNGNA